MPCTLKIKKPKMPTLGEIAPAVVEIDDDLFHITSANSDGVYVGKRFDGELHYRQTPDRIICLLREVDGKMQAVEWDGKPEKNTKTLFQLQGRVVELADGRTLLVRKCSGSSYAVYVTFADGDMDLMNQNVVPDYDHGIPNIEKEES